MHWRLHRLTEGITRTATTYLARRTFRLGHMARYISFSFDDCPMSATTIGTQILDRAGVRATFYLAGALADVRDHSMPYFEPRLLPALVSKGHEVGCHTFDHVAANRLSSIDFSRQIERNKDWMRRVLPGYRMESFSYPFGGVSVAAKRTAGLHYQTARSTLDGLNAGLVDLLLLRANRIYEHRNNLSQLLRLIEAVGQTGGWLIFYTHDVTEQPTSYGCTPHLFKQLVDASVESGCDVMPVGTALEAMRTAATLRAPSDRRHRRP